MGIEEFACGALNDENSRMGVEPGARKGTDPEAKIKQPFITPEKTGGYLDIDAGSELTITFFDDEGQQRYQVKK